MDLRKHTKQEVQEASDPIKEMATLVLDLVQHKRDQQAPTLKDWQINKT